jgi:hypothetical protein
VAVLAVSHHRRRGRSLGLGILREQGRRAVNRIVVFLLGMAAMWLIQRFMLGG